MPTLSETERASLPGAFVLLKHGYVHYELSGPKDGPSIVLVPGLSVPYSTWDRNASALASAGYRVLRYDHYGRGYSDRPRSTYGLELYVEQLAELLPAIGLLRPAFLVGLSMGGPVAAAAAIRHSGLASGLALVDPLCEWPDRGLFARLLAAPILADAIMALFGGMILSAGQRKDFYHESSYDEFIPSYLPQLRYRGIGRAVIKALRSIPSWPLGQIFEDLGRSSLPTQLFWGREDATLPFELSATLMRVLPRAEFRCIEGAGHVPHWEKSEEFNKVLIEFLGRQLSPDAGGKG